MCLVCLFQPIYSCTSHLGRFCISQSQYACFLFFCFPCDYIVIFKLNLFILYIITCRWIKFSFKVPIMNFWGYFVKSFNEVCLVDKFCYLMKHYIKDLKHWLSWCRYISLFWLFLAGNKEKLNSVIQHGNMPSDPMSASYQVSSYTAPTSQHLACSLLPCDISNVHINCS